MNQTKSVAIRSWQFGMAEWLSYGAIVIVPLFVWGANFFPYTSAKSFLIFLFTALLGFLYVWGKAQSRERFTASVLHMLLVAFLLILTASAAFGVNPHISFFGTFLQGTSVALLYALSVCAVAIGGLIRRNERFLPQLLAVSLMTASIVALLTHGKNLGGPLGNDSYTGPYLLINACIGIGLALFYTDLWKKIAAGVGVLLIATSPVLLNLKGSLAHPLTLLGSANGAAIGLGLSVFSIVLFLLVRSGKRALQYIGIGVFIAFLVGAFIGGQIFMRPDSSLHQRFVAQKSANRFVFWDIAAAGFNERPLLGWGYANYDRAYQQYFDPIFFGHGYTPEGAIREPHNIVWEYLSTTGILGLLSYLALLGGTMIALFIASRDDKKRVLYLTLDASLVGYFFQNLFVFDTPVVYLMYFLIIGVALGSAPAWKTISPVGRRAVPVFVCISGVVAIAVVVMLVLQPISESKALYNLIVDPTVPPGGLQKRSVVGGADDIAHVAGKFYIGFSDHFATANAVQKEQYLRIASNILIVLKESIDSDKGSYRAPLIAGTLTDSLVGYKAVDDPQAALKNAAAYLQETLTLNPRNPDSYFAIALNTFYQRDFPLAYSYIKTGILLAPTYDQGYNLATTLLKVKPDIEFETFLQKMKATASLQ